ncbi:MAG: hypothetical protein JNM94_08665 [Phycisphaerae bacterium]|nr:hypothetical protein [Phycisphaerae bacterium]
MLDAPLKMLDDWCAHAELATRFWPWLIGVALVAPLAAWATLAVVHGFGGRALTAPRCLKCKHLNVAGASERCTECGHGLSDGTAWTRRKLRWRDAVRGVALGAGIVALGLAAGGVAFAVLTTWSHAVDPWTRAKNEPLDELLRHGSSSDIALRLGFEQAGSRSADERRRLADAIGRAIADSPDAAKRLGEDPALSEVVEAYHHALRAGVATDAEVVASLASLGATPRILIPRLVPSATVVPIVAESRDRVSARVRNVETFVGPIRRVEQSKNAPSALFVAPAGVCRAVVVVTWDVVLVGNGGSGERRTIEQRTSTFDVLATPGAPQLGVAAAPREGMGEAPTGSIRAEVQGVTFEKVGTQVLLQVSMRAGGGPGSVTVLVGRWTATLHHADGDSARDVSVRLIGDWNRLDYVGLLPSGSGGGEWPPPFDSMTLSFEPDLGAPDNGERYANGWYSFAFAAAEPWRSGRVPIAPRERAE